MTPTGMERRSAQQLERDNLRQRSFEARRAASQPQLLACDEEDNAELVSNRPQPQIPTPIRRGSYGNIMEASGINELEKDSDDGGFLKRIGSKERRLETPTRDTNQTPRPSHEDHRDGPIGQSKEDQKQSEALQGTPRKKLEGEIGQLERITQFNLLQGFFVLGKIEGVYNVGQRTGKTEEDTKTNKKINPSSANSSDYDKTGGQSSSNVDSGRGSAAYSSGRRPGGFDGEQYDSGQLLRGAKYRDSHRSK